VTDRPAKTPQAGDVEHVDSGFGAGQVGEGADPVPQPDAGWTVISWDTDAAVSYENPARRFADKSRHSATRMALGRRRGLQGFCHAVTRPAPGSLAELPGQLALGQRPARLETCAVGGHRGGVDVAVRADGRHRPL